MSQLIGADTRRVDAIAGRLRGYSQDVQNLRISAQRAVYEMRNAWGGGDFEHVAAGWENQAGPRMVAASSALIEMAVLLRAQSDGQSQVSGSAGSIGFLSGTGHRAGSDAIQGDPWLLGGVTVAAGEQPKVHGSDREASILSVAGGNQNFQYELSLGKAEAMADSLLGVDAYGNAVASAGVSAAAYLGYAAGGAQAGNDHAKGRAYGQALVGAAAGARASGLIGVGGASGHVGLEAFAGAKALAGVSGTLAGATAAAGAEVSYGIGAHANVDAALSATKVGVAVDLGAALGLGAGVKLDLSVDPREVMHAVADIEHVLAPEPE
jgi:hypothetical protein